MFIVEVVVLRSTSLVPSTYPHQPYMLLNTQVRERLKVAQERNVVLEDELMLASQEVRVCVRV